VNISALTVGYRQLGFIYIDEHSRLIDVSRRRIGQLTAVLIFLTIVWFNTQTSQRRHGNGSSDKVVSTKMTDTAHTTASRSRWIHVKAVDGKSPKAGELFHERRELRSTL
jgi:hypothetical protein